MLNHEQMGNFGSQLENSTSLNIENKKTFLEPDYKTGLHDPFLMLGVDRAVDRIISAIEKNEKVGVFGDYDADGIPATTLVDSVLKHHKLDTFTFIPKRAEGYGLNERGIDWLFDQGVTLIVTVDLGITGKKQVAYAKTKGIDVIVTDHHEPIEELRPDAYALIDPKQKECKYPFKELSGTGVAFKVMCALCQKTKKLDFDQLKWYLDLVAISTFCDIVPLQDENRILAKFGLVVLSKTKRAGLKKMYEVAGIDVKTISPYTVGFMIGPRLNAPGRMGDCSNSLKLLMAENEDEATENAMKLEEANATRQDILKKVLKEAENKVADEELFLRRIILVSGKDWPEGIVGLVAGRLTDKYARPAIVIGFHDGLGVGSARSVDDFSILEALNQSKQFLIKHGGHTKAAGLTINEDQLEGFYTSLLAIADKELKDENLVAKIRCEMEIEFSQISWDLVEKLEKMEPFGLGNAKPVFFCKNIKCIEKKTLGKSNDHLKLSLSSQGENFSAIGFGLGVKDKLISIGDEIEIAFTIEKDDWRGGKNLQLKLIDFRTSEKGENEG